MVKCPSCQEPTFTIIKYQARTSTYNGNRKEVGIYECSTCGYKERI